MVSKTIDTNMLQTVRSNHISFGKEVAQDQLSHLVINKINHVAMVTTSKNPKWRTYQPPSFGSYIFFLKKLSKTTKYNYKHEFLKKNY